MSHELQKVNTGLSDDANAPPADSVVRHWELAPRDWLP